MHVTHMCASFYIHTLIFEENLVIQWLLGYFLDPIKLLVLPSFKKNFLKHFSGFLHM